jgi:hypothetical protein
MNGDNREVIVSSEFLSAPRGLTLDLTARKMYWVEHHANKVPHARYSSIHVTLAGSLFRLE